jgi:hypothetical protein
MSDQQLALNAALRALERTDALTSGALAQELQLTKLDVHILMLSAQANRLVYKTADATWAITERGRRQLHPGDRDARSHTRPD